MTQPNPYRPRLVQVQSWHDIGKNMRRIVFHSTELADYPTNCYAQPFKLLLPRSGQSKPQLPEKFENGKIIWARPEERPIARTYTVRRFDAVACTLTVDFVLHGDNGPASVFAQNAQIGQTVGISTPRVRETMLKTAAHYLFAGDLTAMPAIEAMCENMAGNAVGTVLLLLPDAADLPHTFRLPEKVKLHHFIGGSQDFADLIQAARINRPADLNDCYVWFAGEAAMVGQLRRLARQEWGLAAAQCYAVPYWRDGEAEEIYHQKRHEFMDNDAD